MRLTMGDSLVQVILVMFFSTIMVNTLEGIPNTLAKTSSNVDQGQSHIRKARQAHIFQQLLVDPSLNPLHRRRHIHGLPQAPVNQHRHIHGPPQAPVNQLLGNILPVRPVAQRQPRPRNVLQEGIQAVGNLLDGLFGGGRRRRPPPPPIVRIPIGCQRRKP